MGKAWIGLAIGLVTAVIAGTASAKTERLVSREQALALARPTWGHSGSGQYLAGQLAQRELDYSNAADYLRGALSWAPNDLDLRRRVFLLMLADGRLDDALAHTNALRRDDPGDMLPSVADAVGAMVKGDGAEAVLALADLNSGGFPGLVRTLGQAWASLAANDLPAARAVLAFSAAEPAWATIIKIHAALIKDIAKTDQAAAAYAAIAEAKGGRSSRSIGLIANFRARQKDPSVAPLMRNARDGMAEAFFSVAAALNQGERALSALIYGQLALTLRPDSDLLQTLVAEVIEQQDRYVDAAAAYARIDTSSPRFAIARLAQARNLARADLPDQAIAALREMTTAGTQSALASILLGDILRGEERFDEAIAAYDAAEAQLGTITADNWRLLYSRGIALERSGQWERAEADLQKALQMQPDEAFVLNYLGYSWIDRGEHLEKAEGMVQRASELKPEDGFIADSLGWAYYRTGRYEDAVRELERAITLQPVDPVINEHLGDAYWQTNRKAEARFQWRRALNFKPPAKLVPTIEEKLRCGLERCAVAHQAN
jgi:tetratricopeptide (TPR) repeat protein